MPGSDEQTIVTEEIIDNSGAAAEEIITENPEENPESGIENPEETQEQETKEDEEAEKDFSIDDLDLSENETTFGKYDLSKYKENLAYENIEAMENLKQFAEKAEKQNFTQDQIEFILDELYQANQEIEDQLPKKMTKAEAEENLKKYLTPDERRDHKVVGNYVKDIIKGSEFEGLEKNIMTDPLLVKFARLFYKKSAGSKVINQSNVPEQKTNVNYTVENAQAQYDKYLKEKPESKREEKTAFLTNLYKKMPEKEKKKFESIFDGLFDK